MNKPKYSMPSAVSGQPVLWSPGADAPCIPATVTSVGINSVTLSILRPGATSFVPKDSVRHVSDPGFRRLHDPSKTGVWDYTPEYKLLAAVAVKTLGPAVAFEICPGLASLIAAYTPAEEASDSSYSDDDPDVHGS